MLETIFIAIALCIDSFALGVTYGIKKIKIPKLALLLMNVMTVSVLGISALFGHMVRQFISEFTASLISCIILIVIGSFFMLEGYLKHLITVKSTCDDSHCCNPRLVNLYIPKLGIIIDIALDMTKADLDVSGDINMKEVLYIGLILSFDSIGAGFGYAVGGINLLYFLSIVFIMNLVSIFCGLGLGNRIQHQRRSLKTSLLPGFIFIVLGILKWVW